jgi:hypothetical protein
MIVTLLKFGLKYDVSIRLLKQVRGEEIRVFQHVRRKRLIGQLTEMFKLG